MLGGQAQLGDDRMDTDGGDGRQTLLSLETQGEQVGQYPLELTVQGGFTGLVPHRENGYPGGMLPGQIRDYAAGHDQEA